MCHQKCTTFGQLANQSVKTKHAHRLYLERSVNRSLDNWMLPSQKLCAQPKSQALVGKQNVGSAQIGNCLASQVVGRQFTLQRACRASKLPTCSRRFCAGGAQKRGSFSLGLSIDASHPSFQASLPVNKEKVSLHFHHETAQVCGNIGPA